VFDLEHSFELDLTWRSKVRDLDLTKKKKQTLDELFASQKISQSTYDHLEKKLTEETTIIEAKLKELSDSMTARAKELEKQIGLLEISLANLEMYHATGEIDDETYENQNKTILLNLEAIKQEIRTVKNFLLEFVEEKMLPKEVVEKAETSSEHKVEETSSHEETKESN